MINLAGKIFFYSKYNNPNIFIFFKRQNIPNNPVVYNYRLQQKKQTAIQWLLGADGSLQIVNTEHATVRTTPVRLIPIVRTLFFEHGLDGNDG